MAEQAARKPYEKPQLVRVDLVADEVALAACKAPFVTSHSTPNTGRNGCKTTCVNISAS